MAAPSRLAGGPPQVSLQLKASEPSVRRAAVPFGKMSRPFRWDGSGRPAIGTVVENLFLGNASRVPQPEPVETPRPRAHGRYQAGRRAFHGREYERDLTPAPITEVAESVRWANRSSWKNRPKSFTASRKFRRRCRKSRLWKRRCVIEETLVVDEAPAIAETAVVEEAAGVRREPVHSKKRPRGRRRPFTEPAWSPVAFEPPAPAFETTTPRGRLAVSRVASDSRRVLSNPSASRSSRSRRLLPRRKTPEPVTAQAMEISGTEIEPVAQGQPIPYQVPAFSTDSPMAEITKPEPESRTFLTQLSPRRRWPGLADSVIRSSLPLSRLKLFPPSP